MARYRSRPRRARTDFVLPAVLLWLPVTATACAPETRYQVLCVFFEDVPLPGESPEARRVNGPRVTKELQPYYVVPESKGSIHPPVRDRRCHECHEMPDPREKAQKGFTAIFSGSVPVLREEPRRLCFKCHEKLLEAKRVHGPVANGLCLQCHNPHASPNRKLLLKKSTAEVCGSCHVKGNFTERSGHAAGTPGECTDCHGPHGGDLEFFLRPAPAKETESPIGEGEAPIKSPAVPAEGAGGKRGS